MDFEAYENVLTPIDKQKVAEVFQILKRIESGKYTNTQEIDNSCSHGSKSPLKQRTLDKWIVKKKSPPTKDEVAISESPPAKSEEVPVQAIQNSTGKELKIIVEKADYSNYVNSLKSTNNDETNSVNLGNAEIGNAVKKKARHLKLNMEGKQTAPNDQQSPVRYNLRSSSNTSAEKSQAVAECSSIVEQDDTAVLQNLVPTLANQKAVSSSENTVPKRRQKRRQSSSDGLYSLIKDIVREGGLTLLDTSAEQEETEEKKNVEEKHSTLPKIICEESEMPEQQIDFCNELNLPKGSKTPQKDSSNSSLKCSEEALVTNKVSKPETSRCAKKSKTNRSVKSIAPAGSELKKNTFEQENNCSFVESKTTPPKKTHTSKLSPRLMKQQSPIPDPIQESTIYNSASKRKKDKKISEKFIKLEDQCDQDVSTNNICSQQDLVSSTNLISKLSESWSHMEKHVKVEPTYQVALSEIDLSNTHTLVTDIENIIFRSECTDGAEKPISVETVKIPMTFDPKENNNDNVSHSGENKLSFTGTILPSSNLIENPSRETSIVPTYSEQPTNINEEFEEQTDCGSKTKSALWKEVGASKEDKETSKQLENNSVPIESDIGIATSNYDLDEDSPTFASDLQNCYEAYMKMKNVFYENLGADVNTLLQDASLQKRIWTTPSDGLFLYRQKLSQTQKCTPDILIHTSKKRLQETLHKLKSKELS